MPEHSHSNSQIHPDQPQRPSSQPLDQQGLSQWRRDHLQELGAQEWAEWRNQAITRAYLQFLADQAIHWRALAADIVVAGGFDVNSRVEDGNPNVVRGKILAVEALQILRIEDIQDFYRSQRDDREDL